MADPATLLEPVRDIARIAGGKILAVYHTAFEVTEKDDRSPLTQADLASHRSICQALAELTPDIPILSEESADLDVAERRRWLRFWLVDPLDGTKEFIKRNGEFTVNIALVEDHRPVLGVVHVPVTGVSYLAAQDRGAFRQDADETPQEIHVQPRHEGKLRVVGSRSHATESLQRFVASLGEHEFVAVGSSLKFCLIAEGGADLYPRLGPTSEWDTAAAQCVVEVAGGRVIDLQGAPLSYNARDTLLNPHFLVCADRSRDWLRYLPANG